LTLRSVGRISPSDWSLLPGASALTRTGLPPARSTRLPGRTMRRILPAGDSELHGQVGLDFLDPHRNQSLVIENALSAAVAVEIGENGIDDLPCR